MALMHVLCVLIPLCMAIVTVHGRSRMSLKACASNSQIRCMVSPCDIQKCAAYPDAECRNSYCGACEAEFWVGNEEVTSKCDQPSTKSAVKKTVTVDNNCTPVQCFMSPCGSATCPGKPTAKCRQHRCECTATFWEGNTEVTDQCQLISTLTGTFSGTVMSAKDCGGQPEVRCTINPCQVETCPAFSNAECRNNYCGRCAAEFWVGSEEVTSRCQSGEVALNTAGGSPDIVSRNLPTKPEMSKPDPTACLSSCFFPPCRLGYCAAFPQARCVDNFCDGCRAQYYVGNNEVTAMCRDRVPSLSRLFSNRRRRFRSFMSPWMAFLDNMF